MLKKMEIISFRNLENINIQLGKAMTIIAGQNGNGKSTILALLGHVSEYDEVTVLGKKFKTEYREIIKSSYPQDIENKRCVVFEFCSDDGSTITEKFHYRSYWNYKEDEKKRRHRILPVRKIGGKESSKKMEYPTYYLGLSRLYPIGESRTVNFVDIDAALTVEEQAYITTKHIQILSMSHIIQEDENKGIIGLRVANGAKRTFGLETSKYGPLNNSAGQDNLSQILAIILSFEKLKNKLGSNWSGGMLLIDELDAALHPLSLNKLFDHIYEKAISIGIQVVATTHSLSLLEYITDKYTENNKNADFNEVELQYLTNGTGLVQRIRNPSFAVIKNGLMVTGGLNKRIKIPILCEDAEAEWIFKNLVPNWEFFFQFIRVTFGDAEMKKIINDKLFFYRALLLHDGDVVYEEDELKKLGFSYPPKLGDTITPTDFVKERTNNVVILPGGTSPEIVLWECMKAEFANPHSPLWDIKNNLTPQWFFEDQNKARVELHDGLKPRNKSKNWFNHLKTQNEDFMRNVISHWVKNNQSEYRVFINMLIRKTKSLSKIHGVLWDARDADSLSEFIYPVNLAAENTSAQS